MKSLIFAVLAIFFVGCTTEVVEDVSDGLATVPQTLTVDFAEDDSRAQLGEDNKTVWSEGDCLSVFYKSHSNLKFEFQGQTGDRTGNFKHVGGDIGGEPMESVVVVYPYASNCMVDALLNVNIALPEVQYYKEESYGVGSSIMVSKGLFTQFSMKNACGWLRLQLTGNGEVVKQIILRGNSGENMAGLLSVDSQTAEATFAEDAAHSQQITLDCGAGVPLSSEVTSFYIAVVPQTFEKGFTIDVNCEGFEPMTITTENSITIERNHIQPMAAVEYEGEAKIPTNQLFYTATAKVEPKADAFDVAITSHEWDATTGKGVITFDGELTIIGEDAFYDCLDLTSIVMPDSVMEIGVYSFNYCPGLESVTLSCGLTKIANYAFAGCGNLTDIEIPEGVTEIGARAFSACSSLKSIIIPDKVESIGAYAFFNCSDAESLTIGNSVKSIENNAFDSCSKLTTVTIPESVVVMGASPFSSCSSLSMFEGKFASEDGKALIDNYGVLISFAPYNQTEYTIPEGVTEIGGSVFLRCSGLQSVTIPESVTVIGTESFYGCSGLTSIIIPNGVKSINHFAFTDCTSLSSITIPESVTTIGFEAFRFCEGLKEVYCKPITPPMGNMGMFEYNADGRKIYVPRASESEYEAADYWSDYVEAIEPYDFVE